MDRTSRSQSLLKRSKNLSGGLGALVAIVLALSSLIGLALIQDASAGHPFHLYRLKVTIEADSVAENAGSDATSGMVFRGKDSPDFNQPLVVTLTSSDTTEATTPATVTIPANEVSASFSISAIDDTEADGTQTVTITASARSASDQFDFLGDADTLDVLDNEGPALTVAIAAASIAENAGPKATTGTVTRLNADITKRLFVRVASDDKTEATVLGEAFFPEGQSTGTFDINAEDDFLLDDTQKVKITASISGFAPGSATLDVTDHETLTVTIPVVSKIQVPGPRLTVILPESFVKSISEGAGPSAAMGTVTRSNTDREKALTVNLSSSDTSEATVPESVTIPENEGSVTFPIAAVEDEESDGDQTVTISASAAGYVSVFGKLKVLDNEGPSITLEIAAALIAENAGKAATTATVTRNANKDISIAVEIKSSDPSEAVGPTKVLLAKGASSTTFSIEAVDDTLLDGSQIVTFTPVSAGFAGVSDSLEVTDFETLTVTLVSASISEAAGSATTGTVTRSNTDIANALEVTLKSSDESEAVAAASSVTIPANQASATFQILAVDDAAADQTQKVTITASAAGYVSVPVVLAVTDDEPPGLFVDISAPTISENAGNAAATGAVVRPGADVAKSLKVNLTSSDPSELTVTQAVTIPAGETRANFSVNAVDDTLLDGSQTVSVTASAPGFTSSVDHLTVTDHETLTIDIPADSISESAGAAAATATVSRSNTDRQEALTVTLTSSDASELNVPVSVTIPANAGSVSFNLAAVDDSDFDGPQDVSVSPSAAGYVGVSDSLRVTDNELKFEIAAGSIAENAGTAATTATVTRNTDTTKPLELALESSDVTEVTVAATVRIPAKASSVTFPLNAVDDNLRDGTQEVTVSVSSPGFATASQTLLVTDHETLSVSINFASISEAGGAGAATGRIALSNTDNQNDLTISLKSSDTSEAKVPASVIIQGNRASVLFNIDAQDDSLADGTQTVTITASASGYVDGLATLDVTDNDALGLTLDIASASIGENAGKGAATATVTRNTEDNSAVLGVTLTTSDATEATSAATITIPAGQASASFEIHAVDDTLLDGDQVVSFTAASPGFAPATDTVTVTDHETVTLATVSSSIVENSGATATEAIVTRSNTDRANELTVTLSSSDTTEATLPASVTIPANEGSVSFFVAAVDDLFADGTKEVTLTPSAQGYVAVPGLLNVTDDEVPALKVEIAADVIAETAGDSATTGTVSRNTEDNSQDLVVTLLSSDVTEVTVAGSVTIPAGEVSATFQVNAVDDHVHDSTAKVTITASAQGFESGSDTLEVTGECGLEVVTPEDHGDWFLADGNPPAGQFSSNTTFILGPSSPPIGECSIRLESGPGTGTIGGVRQGGKPSLLLLPHAGRRLDSIKALTYSTFISFAGTPNLAPYLNIMLLNRAGKFAGTLVFEPLYSSINFGGGTQPAITPGEWQTWDARAGRWWITKPLGTICAFDCFVPLEEYLAQDPDLIIFCTPDNFTIGSLCVLAGQASGGIWANFDGNVDNVTVAFHDQCKTYDFGCQSGVPAPEITIASVSPDTLEVPGRAEDEKSVQVTITGTGFNSLPTSFSVSLGAGISITNFNRVSDTQITVSDATVIFSASGGPRDVSVANVTASGLLSALDVDSITPNTLGIPDTLADETSIQVTIRGKGFQALTGTISVSLGAGITITNVKMVPGEEITAYAKMEEGADAGLRNLEIFEDKMKILTRFDFLTVTAVTPGEDALLCVNDAAGRQISIKINPSGASPTLLFSGSPTKPLPEGSAVSSSGLLTTGDKTGSGEVNVTLDSVVVARVPVGVMNITFTPENQEICQTVTTQGETSPGVAGVQVVIDQASLASEVFFSTTSLESGVAAANIATINVAQATGSPQLITVTAADPARNANASAGTIRIDAHLGSATGPVCGTGATVTFIDDYTVLPSSIFLLVGDTIILTAKACQGKDNTIAQVQSTWKFENETAVNTTPVARFLSTSPSVTNSQGGGAGSGTAVGTLGSSEVSEISSPGASSVTLIAKNIGTVTVRATEAGGSPGSGGTSSKAAATDVCSVTVGEADLDIDSDNDSELAADGSHNNPSQSDSEDKIEDIRGDVEKPGKIIFVSKRDVDGDAVPDFADGIDIFGNFGPSASIFFVPVILEIPPEINTRLAQVKFTYSGSDPANIARTGSSPNFDYMPAEGHLRIWTRDGNSGRLKASIDLGGDYVAPGTSFPLTRLPTSAMIGDGKWRFFIEAVNLSATAGDQEIKVEIDPDGSGLKGFLGPDSVRCSVLEMQFVTRGENDEILEQTFSFNSYSCPEIIATIQDCQVAPDGQVTLTIQGKVSDEASSIALDPQKQIQSLNFSAEGVFIKSIPLVNSATPSPPWRPRKFQADILTQVSFPTGNNPVDDFMVTLETDKNIAGCVGRLDLFLIINPAAPGSGLDTNGVIDVFCTVENATSGAGTFFPSMIRIKDHPSVLSQGPVTVKVFGTDWQIARKNLGDGEFWYAVDDNGDPVIFLPSSLARSEQNVKEITLIFDAVLSKEKQNIMKALQEAKVDMTSGLIVRTDHSLVFPEHGGENILKTIKGFRERKHQLGDKWFYIYDPSPDGDFGHIGNTVSTEILWRFIGTADRGRVFSSKLSLLTEMNYRVNVVNTVDKVTFPFGPEKFNQEFWDEKTWQVREGKSAFDAVKDALENPERKTLYQGECFVATRLVTGRAASEVLTRDNFDNLVRSNPLVDKPPFIQTYNEKVQANWIPGDWGYIDNTQEGQGPLDGENIIYLGGSFDTNFEQFKKSAIFWGHFTAQTPGDKKLSLEEWIKKVDRFNDGLENGDAVVLLQRISLKQ